MINLKLPINTVDDNSYSDKYLGWILKALSSDTPDHDIKEIINRVYTEGYEDGVNEEMANRED